MMRNSEAEILNIVNMPENSQGMEQLATVSQVHIRTSDDSCILCITPITTVVWQGYNTQNKAWNKLGLYLCN